MNLKALLENLDKSVISEETATAIAEAFETAVNEKVTARVNLQVENALSTQDEEHASKLQKLIEAIDLDHTDKLKQVINTINEDHTKKLDALSTHYRKALNEKAAAFSNMMLDEVSRFLDVALEKALPKAQLEEAVKNTQSRVQLEKIRQIVGFDSSMVNESVKSTISEGKKAIDDLSVRLNESYKDNEALLGKLKSFESSLVLESRTNGMPKAKKEFIFKLLKDKNSSYIEENFNYVVEMFERSEEEVASDLLHEAKQTAKSRDAKVPARTVVAESATITDTEFGVGGYLSELQKTERLKK